MIERVVLVGGEEVSAPDGKGGGEEKW